MKKKNEATTRRKRNEANLEGISNTIFAQNLKDRPYSQPFCYTLNSSISSTMTACECVRSPREQENKRTRMRMRMRMRAATNDLEVRAVWLWWKFACPQGPCINHKNCTRVPRLRSTGYAFVNRRATLCPVVRGFEKSPFLPVFAQYNNRCVTFNMRILCLGLTKMVTGPWYSDWLSFLKLCNSRTSPENIINDEKKY